MWREYVLSRFQVGTMGLTQVVAASHVVRHMLELVFTARQVDSDADVEEFKITCLSWTDHFLVGLDGLSTDADESTEDFLRSLGDFPGIDVSDTSKGLAVLWNEDMNIGMDQIISQYPLPHWSNESPWFFGAGDDEVAFRGDGKKLVMIPSWTLARAQVRATYSIAMITVKRAVFSATIVSVENFSAELFQVVQNIFHLIL